MFDDNIPDKKPKVSWVNNELANEVVSKVQKSIATGEPNREAMQQMMDLISNVEGYKTGNVRRQGVIRRTFEQERLKHNGTRAGNTATFGVDLDDVVATFWEHVFKYLPHASSTGGVVPVRVVRGQEHDNLNNDAAPLKGGLAFVQRNTNCNPIHHLRNMGIMGVRNLLNKSYRRNIAQACDDCGYKSSITKKEESPRCPKCAGIDTEKYWPDGNSSYRSRKGRKCLGCGHKWIRQFTRKCSKCKSENVRTDVRIQTLDDTTTQIASEGATAENQLVQNDLDRELEELADKIFEYLPNDPSDPKAISRTKQTFLLMVKPETSRDMCSKCVFAAPLVCEEKCDEFKKKKKCTHLLVKDPSKTCGEETFSISRCVNYSKKIAEYHGCSASLSARRVKKVREYVKRYFESKTASPRCVAAAKLIGTVYAEA